MLSATITQRPGWWLWWLGANVAGYALGVALWQSTYPALRPALGAPVGGIVSVAGFGATIGLCAGLAQAVVVRRDLVQVSLWVLTTMIAYALGFLVAAAVIALLNNALEPRVGLPLTDAALLLVFGALVGASIGAARGLVVRANGGALSRLALGSAVGLMIGYPLAIGVLELLPELDQPVVGLAFGLCAGATTALIEWLIARNELMAAWRDS
jgi:phage shock protein PspC (stress-responsive transcriptional regulator)